MSKFTALLLVLLIAAPAQSQELKKIEKVRWEVCEDGTHACMVFEDAQRLATLWSQYLFLYTAYHTHLKEIAALQKAREMSFESVKASQRAVQDLRKELEQIYMALKLSEEKHAKAESYSVFGGGMKWVAIVGVVVFIGGVYSGYVIASEK